MWTPELGENVSEEEGFHHAENRRALFGDDVTYCANHTKRSLLVLRILFTVRSSNHREKTG
jgi:hypothetical protein